VCVKARTHFAAAALVTRPVLGLPRCFRSPGELCPEASACCACRRTAAGVGAFHFARCYRSLRALSPSRPPLLKYNIRRCGGFPGKSGHCAILVRPQFMGSRVHFPTAKGRRQSEAAYSVLECRWGRNLQPCQFTIEVALDSDRKTLAGIALRAFESAHVITRSGRFDLGQPHGVAALGARKDSDFSTAVEWIRMGGWHDARLRSGGSVILSVTGNCRQGAVMHPAYSPWLDSRWSILLTFPNSTQERPRRGG
jgi:hypothetical protein